MQVGANVMHHVIHQLPYFNRSVEAGFANHIIVQPGASPILCHMLACRSVGSIGTTCCLRNVCGAHPRYLEALQKMRDLQLNYGAFKLGIQCLKPLKLDQVCAHKWMADCSSSCNKRCAICSHGFLVQRARRGN